MRDVAHRARQHCLELEFMGPGHKPSCACGWSGIPGKRGFAINQYRDHRREIERARGGIGVAVCRQRLTPAHLLPELLR